jgi:septal ring factor EnvC (AmiA/AmiB activator)
MNKNTISKGNNMKNNPIKAKVINVDATDSVKLQAYKKSITDKAKQEINKIKEEIKSLEQNKI